MHSFLGEMDPAFVVCHDFDRVGDVNQAHEIAEVLAPSPEVADILAQSFVQSVDHHPRLQVEEPLPFEAESVVIDRFQRKLAAFESIYCSSGG